MAWTIRVDNPTQRSENPFAGGITDRSAQPGFPKAADAHLYYREGVLWVDAFQAAPGTPAQVRVFNANGRLLLSESIEPSHPNQLQLGKQPAGVYLVNILANKEQTTRKVVIAGN